MKGDKEKYVSSESFAKANKLKIVYAGKSNEICLRSVLVNRPGLIFTGYDNFFAESRVQVVGNAESAYLKDLAPALAKKRIEYFMNKNIPCVIVSRSIEIPDNVVDIAKNCNCPIFTTDAPTSLFVNKLTHYLDDELAETKSLHGVLLDISGIGVLLVGKNGIGKSETALELVHRGHLLVADDVVMVKKIKNDIIGRASENIRNLLEVRGVGIINVEDMYGIGGVLDSKKIDIVVELADWKSNVDRFGNSQNYEDILGVEIPKLIVPVIAGRNLAIVIEAATKNIRLKRLGKDPTKMLIEKFENNKN